jgi:effector-binding domain-containing protein
VLEPRILECGEQPYVAIQGLVTMQTFDHLTDRFPELYDWLAARGIEPAGQPFLKLNVIDMERELAVEAGVPVAVRAVVDDEVRSGTLPAGRYVTVTHVGQTDELVAATDDLFTWAQQRGLAWDSWDTEAGSAWGCRLVIDKTTAGQQSDPDKRVTELRVRLADSCAVEPTA